MAFRSFPPLRRAWLVTVLRLYHGLFEYANFVSGIALGTSPKLAFPDWGMQAFFLPRIPPGSRVLDVGCGHGSLAEVIAERAGAVFAFDRDPIVVRAAKERTSRKARRPMWFCADASRSLPTGQVDVVLLSSILPFVDDPQRLLAEAARIAPRALIRETRADRDFTMPLARSLGGAPTTDPNVRREYTSATLVAELRRAGWVVREMHETYDIYVMAERP